jgi:release factor H-coupled RctB family protein
MGSSSLQIIAENISVVASEKTWIEGDAIQQLQTTAKLDGMRRVVGMPDLHPGRGYPVGAAFFSVGRYYPALIGGDIGCGMSLWKTDLSTAKFSIDKLVKRLGNIDAPLIDESDAWRDKVLAYQLADTGYEHALGSIGGGNHFAELQHIDQVYDQACMLKLGVDQKKILVLAHSGSRGFGGQILRDHVDQFRHAGLPEKTPQSDAYLRQHQRALQFARANRSLIAQRICANLGTGGEVLVDIDHNLLTPLELDGQAGWLHRKGATPADQGLVVIPGSRGDYSYLVEPIASPLSLYSLAHGAGRKWMRSECEARLSQRYSMAQLAKTSLGNRVICNDKALLFEEAPQAYKPIDSIIDSLQEAGLIKLVARLKPLVSYKTSGGCCA